MTWQFRKEPAILLSIKRKYEVEKWSYVAPNEILVELKNVGFTNLLVRSIPISLGFEPRTELMASVELARPEEMTAQQAELYKKLKSMEFEIVWSRLKRELRLVPRSELKELQEFIPGFVPNEHLIKDMAQNRSLMNLLHIVKPEEMYAALDSIRAEDIPSIKSKEDYLRKKAEFFNTPSNIKWLISVTKLFVFRRFPGHERIYNQLVEVLDLTSTILRKNTHL